MKFEEFEKNVIIHFARKGLYVKSSPEKQCLKLVEEVGELCKAILEDQSEDKKMDGVGDSIVVLINIAHQLGFYIETCTDYAWNEIKDRTGHMVNGTFIKDS